MTSFCCFRKCLQWYLELLTISCCPCRFPHGSPCTGQLQQEAGSTSSTGHKCPSLRMSLASALFFETLLHPKALSGCPLLDAESPCVSRVTASYLWLAALLLGNMPLFASNQACWDGCTAVAGTAGCCGTLLTPGCGCFGSWTGCQGVCHHLRSNTGLPAGFLKCKLQLQCDTYPLFFPFLF